MPPAMGSEHPNDERGMGCQLSEYTQVFSGDHTDGAFPETLRETAPCQMAKQICFCLRHNAIYCATIWRRRKPPLDRLPLTYLLRPSRATRWNWQNTTHVFLRSKACSALVDADWGRAFRWRSKRWEHGAHATSPSTLREGAKGLSQLRRPKPVARAGRLAVPRSPKRAALIMAMAARFRPLSYTVLSRTAQLADRVTGGHRCGTPAHLEHSVLKWIKGQQ